MNLYESAQETYEVDLNGTRMKQLSPFRTAKWFLPIEQAFLLKNLHDYKNNLAIFSKWSAYSRFVVMVVPKETEVCMHIGITAPQSLIENRNIQDILEKEGVVGYHEEINKRIETHKKYLKGMGYADNNINEHLWRFCESFPGGATQIFVEFAENYYLYDIDAIYNVGCENKSNLTCGYLGKCPNQKFISFKPNYSTERIAYTDWSIPKSPKVSHFFNNDKEAQIHINKGFAKIFMNNDFEQENFDIDAIIHHLLS